MAPAILRPLALLCFLLAAPGAASADTELKPMKRIYTNGDFVIFGNTLGLDCPVTNTSQDCEKVTNRGNGIDAYYAHGGGVPTAAQANSSARLELPSNAEIVYARLYWAATAGATLNRTVSLTSPQGISQRSDSEVSLWFLNPGATSVTSYQNSVDVTSQVKGPGTYTVNGIDLLDLANRTGPEKNVEAFAAWAMVVYYRQPSAQSHFLFEYSPSGSLPAQATLTDSVGASIEVPIPSTSMGVPGVLGIVGFQTVAPRNFYQPSFNTTPLQDDADSQSLFNSSYMRFGVPAATSDDAPNLVGKPLSMNGVDIDTLRVSFHEENTFVMAPTGTPAWLGALVGSVQTNPPLLATVQADSSDAACGAIDAAKPVSYQLKLTNQSSSAVTINQVEFKAALELKIHLIDGLSPKSDGLYKFEKPLSLAPGENKIISFTADLPSTATPGSMYAINISQITYSDGSGDITYLPGSTDAPGTTITVGKAAPSCEQVFTGRGGALSCQFGRDRLPVTALGFAVLALAACGLRLRRRRA